MDAVPTVLIVGGGIAGLVMARELAIGGMRVTLLEASDHLGGKVARHIVGGIPLDSGAESFATRRGTVADLARQLGLDTAIEHPNPQGAWLQAANGVARPLPKTGLLGIPSTPLATDVIRVIGFAAALRAQLDLLLLGFVGAKEQNLGRLVRKRMGRGVLERLVAPITLGIHSKHPDDLEVDVVAPGLRAAMLDNGGLAGAVRALRVAAPAGSAVAGIRGGMFELVEALQRDLRRFGVEVRLSSPVVSVDATGARLADGSTVTADRVVLAANLGVPSAALPAPAPSIVLVTLVVDGPLLDSSPRGTGVLVAPGHRAARAKALTHSTAKWQWLAATIEAHRHVLRLSYSRPPAEGLREQARADASALLGITIASGDVVDSAVTEWSAPSPRPNPITGVVTVGEGTSGTGLAAVISHARSAAAGMIGGVAE